MKIAGPFLDAKRKKSPKKWYLSYFVPRLNREGAPTLNERGRPVLDRKRPYYGSKEDAEKDKPRIRSQLAVAGTETEGGVLTRTEAEEYRQGKLIAPEVHYSEAARFWRLHHPLGEAKKLSDYKTTFLDWVKTRLGETRHYLDLKNRLTPFLAKFGPRIPDTITRQEVLDYLFALNSEKGAEGRTVLNHKRALCAFFNWLLDEVRVVKSNPAGGIKKRSLPKATVREIGFLDLGYVEKYLRACERYDPDLVAHEVVQLFAGVRADDEMEDFRGEWILLETKEVVVPAEVAKIVGRRDVINNLEDCFWSWWKEYGRKGLLRGRNYEPRWKRIRFLATIEDRGRADTLAALPIKTLLGLAEAKAMLDTWPWNARRRTFCTYHVAKHQSAQGTVLILRHHGSPEVLHKSYRGLGVSQAKGVAYFALQPKKQSIVILPVVVPRGIVLQQRLARTSSQVIADAVAMLPTPTPSNSPPTPKISPPKK